MADRLLPQHHNKMRKIRACRDRASGANVSPSNKHGLGSLGARGALWFQSHLVVLASIIVERLSRRAQPGKEEEEEEETVYPGKYDPWGHDNSGQV